MKFSKDAYLHNTNIFSKYGVGLVLGPKIVFGGGVGTVVQLFWIELKLVKKFSADANMKRFQYKVL